MKRRCLSVKLKVLCTHEEERTCLLTRGDGGCVPSGKLPGCVFATNGGRLEAQAWLAGFL